MFKRLSKEILSEMFSEKCQSFDSLMEPRKLVDNFKVFLYGFLKNLWKKKRSKPIESFPLELVAKFLKYPLEEISKKKSRISQPIQKENPKGIRCKLSERNTMKQF